MGKSREEEYIRRMKALGYEPSLAGMDDEDIEYELNKMDQEQGSQPMETMLNRGYRPPDRDFAERIFKMFARPFDPNWQMPNLDGPEYRQPARENRPEIWPQPGRGNNPRSNRPEPVLFADTTGDGQDGDSQDSGQNWSTDPLGMFPQYGDQSSAAGGTAGSGTLDRYRENEVVQAPNSGGYMDAGASRDNEARSGTADDFTFTADPLESMQVRREAKSNTYGMVRQNSDGTPRPHQGIDIVAEPGTLARAVEDGKVLAAGNDEGGYGHWVKIEFEKNGKKHYAFYAHLSEPAKVKKDETVSAGQVIGWTGNSGNAAGLPAEDAHLHFEVHTQPGFGSRLEGRRDPMPHFRTRMKVDENK